MENMERQMNNVKERKVAFSEMHTMGNWTKDKGCFILNKIFAKQEVMSESLYIWEDSGMWIIKMYRTYFDTDSKKLHLKKSICLPEKCEKQTHFTVLKSYLVIIMVALCLIKEYLSLWDSY